jgi:plasmid maintenance system antidote protein VapI
MLTNRLCIVNSIWASVRDMNIKEMLSCLIAGGYSQSSLARALGTTQPTIHRILEKDQGLSYELGKKIESLYEQAQQDKAA